MSPSPTRVALSIRCPVGLSGAFSVFTRAGCWKEVLCVDCVCSPVVIQPWWLFACQREGLTLGLMGCEDWL